MTEKTDKTNPLWVLGGAVAASGVAMFALSTVYKDDKVAALPKGGTFLTKPVDTFSRVLNEGVRDDELSAETKLKYKDPRMENVENVFNHAWEEDRIDATKLASSGQYFGPKPMPIRIEVYASGKMKLTNGHPFYAAARAMGAKAILAHVVQYSNGRPIASHTAPVRLL